MKAVNEGSSISLKYSAFLVLHFLKIHFHTYCQSIFVAIWSFWLFRKNCKIWVWANFRGQFLENFPFFLPIFLEVHRKVCNNQPKLFPELLESKKIFHLKYQKSAKIGGSLKIFQNLGPHNSRMGFV